MKAFHLLFFAVLAFSFLGGAGCTAPAVEPTVEPAAIAEPDLSYRTRAIHPPPEIAAVRELFAKPGVPALASLEKCDFDYRVETMLSRSIEELFTTLPEHVRSDPEKYHWCFYAKMLELENEVEGAKKDGPEAQRNLVLKRYRFFIYLARIFEVDLEDPRYLDFARRNYRRLMKQLD